MVRGDRSGKNPCDVPANPVGLTDTIVRLITDRSATLGVLKRPRMGAHAGLARFAIAFSATEAMRSSR
jgi:hypothetical protein